MKNIAKVLFSLFFVIQIYALIGCGGGGGGKGTEAVPQKDIFAVLANIDKKVSNEADTEIGDLALNGISLNLVKGALAGDSNVTIKQYSNEAAMARLQEQYSELATFTAVSSLYELSAKDKNSNVITSLEEPSEISILIAEDVDSNKIYYAAAKQNGEWILIPLEDGSGRASLRGAASLSKTVKLILTAFLKVYLLFR